MYDANAVAVMPEEPSRARPRRNEIRQRTVEAAVGILDMIRTRQFARPGGELRVKLLDAAVIQDLAGPGADEIRRAGGRRRARRVHPPHQHENKTQSS